MKFVRLGSIGFAGFFLLISANLTLSGPQLVFTTKEAGNWEIFLIEDINFYSVNPVY